MKLAKNKFGILDRISMINKVRKSDIVPEFNTIDDTIQYSMVHEKFKILSECTYYKLEEDEQVKYNLSIRNDEKRPGFPKKYESTGFVSWVIHNIAERKYEYRNWDAILNQTPFKPLQNYKLYKKIADSSAIVLGGNYKSPSVHETWGVRSYSCLVDGYRIQAYRTLNDFTGKYSYDSSVFDRNGIKKLHHTGLNANLIFMLLKHKKEKVI